MQGLAGLKSEILVVKDDLCALFCPKMHFDTALGVIVEGMMFEIAEFDMRSEFAFHTREQVEIENRPLRLQRHYRQRSEHWRLFQDRPEVKTAHPAPAFRRPGAGTEAANSGDIFPMVDPGK